MSYKDESRIVSSFNVIGFCFKKHFRNLHKILPAASFYQKKKKNLIN